MREMLLVISVVLAAGLPREAVARGRAVTTARSSGGADQGGGAASSPSPLSPAASRKAEALLRDKLPCLGCHALGGLGGRIAPDLATVRTRRSAEYVAAIVDTPARVVPSAPMPRTLMPPATRDLIVRYLQSRPGNATGAVPSTPLLAYSAPVSDGTALYLRWCAACHGAKGLGDGPNARSLPIKPSAHADTRAMSKRPDDSLYDTIAGGGAIMNRSPRMPAFGATLAPAEIRSLVGHIRSLCRCQGPAWSRDDAPTS